MLDLRRTVPLLALIAFSGAGCADEASPPGDTADGVPDPRMPHARYERSLVRSGLEGTALLRDWRAASRTALRAPPPTSLPHTEEGFISAERPEAVGLAFALSRGRRLRARVGWSSDGGRLFTDLFRRETGGGFEHVASLEPAGGELRVPAFREGEYVLRLQPELLRGGRYTVELTESPLLSFPVDGRNESAIRSFFGAPRDGGSRDHHGVDIFAPRGTPVLAAATGTVSRVDTTPLGGRVVWMRESEGGSALYYAHLEEFLVRRGDRVEVGDSVGLVGNSGNARTTPPHLHFGIYRRGEGPLDPLPFLRTTEGEVVEAPVLPGEPGTWVGLDGGRLTGSASRGYRVRYPDGSEGWVAEGASRPAVPESVALPSSANLRTAPRPGAPRIGVLPAGRTVEVLGRYRGWSRVRVEGLGTGWIRTDAEVSRPGP